MAEKLLVVDDEIDTLKLVALMLKRQGYEVRTAENGPAALELIAEEIPDLLLLDVMMPKMDGYEVARRLRADPKTENIPIIMFTAKSQIEDKITGLEAGADAYLTKPTQPRELFAQVKAVLRTKKAATVLPSVSAMERGYTIGLLGVRGGLGVSTLAINLGITLQKKSKAPVIVAELRPGYGGISLDLGYPNPDGLRRLLQRSPGEITPQNIEMALMAHSSGLRLLLASPRPKDAALFAKVENFKVIAHQLAYLGRFILLDLGAALPPTTQAVLPTCDELIVAVEPSPNGVHQTKALLEDLYELGVGEGRVRLVMVNRVRSSVQLNWSKVQEDLGVKIATVFTPAPELAYQASTLNQPMVLQQPGSITAQQFAKLAEAITHEGS